ncbi:MAG: acyl carrier protein [Hyphomonadaceae bacterium]|nr:acyl carrier protein [Hyphomonadaceae bacterium]
MTEPEVLDGLTRILRDLLQDESITLTAATERPDVPGWDSFAYVNFIVAVESEFGVRFQLSDVEAFQNVGEIARQILALKR